MKIDIKKLPKNVEQLEEIIYLQQQELNKKKQEIENQKREIISHKERYIRLLEEFKLEKYRRFSSSSEKNIFQSDLFDEPGIELPEELKDQLDDKISVEGYTYKKHPYNYCRTKN